MNDLKRINTKQLARDVGKSYYKIWGWANGYAKLTGRQGLNKEELEALLNSLHRTGRVVDLLIRRAENELRELEKKEL